MRWFSTTLVLIGLQIVNDNTVINSHDKYVIKPYLSVGTANATGFLMDEGVAGHSILEILGFKVALLVKTVARDWAHNSSSPFVPTETVDPSKAESLLFSRCDKRWRMTLPAPTTEPEDVLGNSESETEWDDRPLPTEMKNRLVGIQQQDECQGIINIGLAAKKAHSETSKQKQKNSQSTTCRRLDATVTVHEGGGGFQRYTAIALE